MEGSRRRWEDIIRVDLEDIGINAGNWVDSAQDRDYWRALLHEYDIQIKLLIENKLIICALGNLHYRFSREKNLNQSQDSNLGPLDFSRGRFEHELA